MPVCIAIRSVFWYYNYLDGTPKDGSRSRRTTQALTRSKRQAKIGILNMVERIGQMRGRLFAGKHDGEHPVRKSKRNLIPYSRKRLESLDILWTSFAILKY